MNEAVALLSRRIAPDGAQSDVPRDALVHYIAARINSIARNFGTGSGRVVRVRGALHAAALSLH